MLYRLSAFVSLVIAANKCDVLMSGVNASYLGKHSSVNVMLNIIFACGKRHTVDLKLALENLCNLTKSSEFLALCYSLFLFNSVSCFMIWSCLHTLNKVLFLLNICSTFRDHVGGNCKCSLGCIWILNISMGITADYTFSPSANFCQVYSVSWPLMLTSTHCGCFSKPTFTAV